MGHPWTEDLAGPRPDPMEITGSWVIRSKGATEPMKRRPRSGGKTACQDRVQSS